MSKSLPIRFSRKDPNNFFETLNKRVNSYFEENKIARTGNASLFIKTVIMFSLFIAPYILMLSLNISQWWMLLFTVIIGIGMAGVGMNVMHDGNHGVFSSRKWVNKLMGGSMFILAGNVYNWKVQHNVLHHTYTNVDGHDEDLDAGRVIRFSEHSKWFWFHQFQQYYSILLYSLLTFNWAIFTDFKQTRSYLKRNLSYGKMPNPVVQWSTVIISKIVYLFVWIVLPMIFVDIAWWKVLIGFLVMHCTAGLILSVIFQLAHVVEAAEMPLPDAEGKLKSTWAIHQLFTTVNFSTKSRFLNWFTGGLNHQVEHHLYPNISHVHYKNIAKIVRETALEFNLPYHEYETMWAAVQAHFRHLKKMGAKPTADLQATKE